MYYALDGTSASSFVQTWLTHISPYSPHTKWSLPPPPSRSPWIQNEVLLGQIIWNCQYVTLFDLQQFHIVQSNINSSLGQWPHITSPSIRIYSFLWNSPSSKVISSVGSYILFFPDSQTTLSVSFRTYITLFLELLFFITCSPHLSTRRTMSR